MKREHTEPSLLVVSGLRSFAADPWQDWLEHIASEFADVRWVRPQDGEWPDADRWADRIDQALAPAAPGGIWVLAHGFGALAVVRHAVRHAALHAATGSGPAVVHDIAHDAAHQAPARPQPPAWSAAVLLAPATPQRFGMAAADLDRPLGGATTVVAATQTVADGYPWLHGDEARHWARRWGSDFVDAGAGPRAAEGPAVWLLGRQLLDALVQQSLTAAPLPALPQRTAGQVFQ
jgi:predicted alpha/beta hydrolase family esterase